MKDSTSLARYVFDFILFTSIFVAFCAVGMVWQTYHVFNLTYHTNYLLFVFFGCLCSYNFHWYLTPPLYNGSHKIKWSARNKKFHLILCILGFVICLWLATKLLLYWKWMLVTALVAFLYSAPKIPLPLFNALKKIAIGKTIFLSVVWTHSTVVLPFIISGTAWQLQHLIFVFNRFFLIYCICILFDYRDKEDDKKEGIKSLITYLPDKGIKTLYTISLLLFFATGVAMFVTGLPVLTALALAVPGLILSLGFSHFKTATSDYLFYFLLDGLMVLSALLIFMIRFT